MVLFFLLKCHPLIGCTDSYAGSDWCYSKKNRTPTVVPVAAPHPIHSGGGRGQDEIILLAWQCHQKVTEMSTKKSHQRVKMTLFQLGNVTN